MFKNNFNVPIFVKPSVRFLKISTVEQINWVTKRQIDYPFFLFYLIQKAYKLNVQTTKKHKKVPKKRLQFSLFRIILIVRSKSSMSLLFKFKIKNWVHIWVVFFVNFFFNFEQRKHVLLNCSEFFF